MTSIHMGRPLYTPRPRLEELVLHLSDCEPELAIDAVRSARGGAPRSLDDALQVVAAALVRLKPRVPVTAA